MAFDCDNPMNDFIITPQNDTYIEEIYEPSKDSDDLDDCITDLIESVAQTIIDAKESEDRREESSINVGQDDSSYCGNDDDD